MRTKAFVGGYEADVFISYARLDDKPVMGDPVGWVSQLHTELINQLPVYLGAEAQIWRDQEEIRNNEDFTKKISHQLENSATLIAILSESFVNREWCRREVEEFAEHAHKRFGVYIDGDKKRIFSVERMPVSRDVLPSQLEGTTTYRFFDGARILQPTVDDRHRAKYLACIHDLVYDISRVLKLLAKSTAPGAALASAEPEAPAVYLAQTTSSLDDQAAEIRRDLTERGFRVFPNGDLPQRAARFTEEVTASLAKCTLSIHLVGADYGFVPEGEPSKSNVWLQHEMALRRAKSDDFACLVWVTPNGKATDARQQNFLTFLEEDDDAQKHMDLLQNCGLEELKAEAHDKLAQLAEKRAKAAQAKQTAAQSKQTPAPAAAKSATAIPQLDEPPIIYLICDDASRKSPDLVALRKHLLAKGYDPIFLEKGEDGGATLQQHIENLNLCDACLIFYDRNMPEWLAQKLGDLRKYLRGRARPVLARAVYHVPSEGEDDIETNAAIVINGAGGFAPAQLAPFVEKIDAALQEPAA